MRRSSHHVRQGVAPLTIRGLLLCLHVVTVTMIPLDALSDRKTKETASSMNFVLNRQGDLLEHTRSGQRGRAMIREIWRRGPDDLVRLYAAVGASSLPFSITFDSHGLDGVMPSIRRRRPMLHRVMTSSPLGRSLIQMIAMIKRVTPPCGRFRHGVRVINLGVIKGCHRKVILMIILMTVRDHSVLFLRIILEFEVHRFEFDVVQSRDKALRVFMDHADAYSPFFLSACVQCVAVYFTKSMLCVTVLSSLAISFGSGTEESVLSRMIL